ncbi:unnamed protein product [Urochloa decumbens]|uniref:Uncharacterized protein n=1 Tax=Urochloa decumbens TaxID=240449 RepID=A0ABC9FRU9_9POAL
MGSAVSSAANGLGTLVGSAVAAPFRALFGASCEGVCSGTWDLPCFVEHLCVSSLARLFVVAILTYIVLLFGYLLCKLGIVKCVAKNAFKTVWIPCSACCRALGGACCLLWRKVRDTKRVYRGRRGRRQEDDVELGELSVTSTYDDTGGASSSSSSSSDDDGGDDRCGGVTAGGSRSRGQSSSVRERRKDRIRQSLRLKRVSSKAERAARVSDRHRWSGRRDGHSTGPPRRITEVPPPSPLRVLHGSPARGRHRHSHAHRRT